MGNGMGFTACGQETGRTSSTHAGEIESSDRPKRGSGRVLMENLVAPARSSGAFSCVQSNIADLALILLTQVPLTLSHNIAPTTQPKS